MKPNDLETLKIATAFCKLQLNLKRCVECPFDKAGGCGWFRDKIISRQAIAFAINEWEKIKGVEK